MNLGKEKIREFLSEKTAHTVQKIERTPQEKFFLFFLLLVAASALVLGYIQFQRNLQEPFYTEYLRIKRAELKEKLQPPPSATLDQQRISELQGKDSDADGLSDYSELYVYATNAYRPDTDSDGIPDKQEVLAGSDPNCAPGTICTPAAYERSASAAPATSAQPSGTSVNIGASSPTELQELTNQVLSGQITLQELGINDPNLQEALNQVGALQGISGTATSQLTEEEQQALKAQLGSLTPAQLREQLRALGMDEQALAAIDDATLLQIFSQSLGDIR